VARARADKRDTSLRKLFLLGALVPAVVVGAERPTPVAGTFEPVGTPRDRSAADVAGTCVVDLVRDYVLSGSLEGSMEIDFRIFVAGPCGAPPGTYDEYWIAHGSYSAGTRGAAPRSGALVYLANVLAGGDVAGTLVLADGLHGALDVTGNFAAGALHYRGEIGTPKTGADPP
jgi:hypothetical protein